MTVIVTGKKKKKKKKMLKKRLKHILDTRPGCRWGTKETVMRCHQCQSGSAFSLCCAQFDVPGELSPYLDIHTLYHLTGTEQQLCLSLKKNTAVNEV